MYKKHSFLFALVITLFLAGNYLFFVSPFEEKEIVMISRVIDGDTVELDDGRKVRLLNINAPEKGKFGSKEASEFLEKYKGKNIEMEKNGVDRYGRVLGRLFLEEYINLELVREGLVHNYLIEEVEEKEFVEAENRARENNLGIWKHSENYDCLDAEINKKEEYVSILNKCDVRIGGWEIKDESTKDYEFKRINEKKFILFSGKGEDKDGEYYWGRGKVWNDDKDAIFIRDQDGLLVYYDSYGY